MILRFRLFNWRFTFVAAPVVDIIGVNSLLPDGNHIPMWDFDNVNFWQVHDALLHVQRVYHLPNIYILETKPKTNFIAYCFKRLPWRKVVEIIAYTPHVDWYFFKYGVYREKFTLRVSAKEGRKPRLVYILRSPEPEDVFIEDLKSWVKYETWPSNYKSPRIELEVTKCGASFAAKKQNGH